MFNFEKLDVWQEAIAFSDLIYQLTSRFPADERFGLVNQLRRAVVSIAANIAEGSSRSSLKEFLRFVEVAYGSLIETVSHCAIARRQGFLQDEEYKLVYAQAEKLGRMLSGLRQSLRRDSASQP
ncbi:MAG: four helix bundle protein [Planctomycetaceae bacterium]|nr:four helix bundle protein [Planctomycetaceae bacterium]